MLTHFLPHRVEIELIFALRVAVSGTISFKIAIFGHETWNLKKSAGSCIWTIFLPQGVEIVLIFALPAAFTEISSDFHYYQLFRSNLEFEKRARRFVSTK